MGADSLAERYASACRPFVVMREPAAGQACSEELARIICTMVVLLAAVAGVVVLAWKLMDNCQKRKMFELEERRVEKEVERERQAELANMKLAALKEKCEKGRDEAAVEKYVKAIDELLPEAEKQKTPSQS